MIVIKSDFNANTDGFRFVDDSFRATAKPAYANGARGSDAGFTGAGLRVVLGGVDEEDVLGMSAGWERSFNLESPQEVTITFRYNLTQNSEYERDELSQVLLAIDDTLVMVNGKDFIAQIAGNGSGGPDRSTGWIPTGINLGILSAGSHRITIGAFNNKKTAKEEETELLIDDVTVQRWFRLSGSNSGNHL